MSSASVRTILPLAVITCTSMLAMDLYLPAVPTMQRGLGLSVAEGQATVAVYLAGLAASQLVWGEALHRIGPRTCVKVGLWMLIAASFGCALAPELWSLLAMRLLQGIAAGASTVVSPTVIRATLPDKDGVRGMAAIAMIEAVIPAAGPVLGTVLLLVTDWRTTFVVIGVVALLSMPFALGATPKRLPHHEEDAPSGYLALLRDTRYLRLALSHALCFGALLVFVGSAPQVLQVVMQWGDGAFATAQVCGVAAFIAVASQSGRISAWLGPIKAIRSGAVVHVLLCAGFWWACVHGAPRFGEVLAFWVVFCGTLAIRGPAAFSEALRVPMVQMGRASALMVLLILAMSAAATQAVAPFLQQAGIAAVLTAMLALSIASLLLTLQVRAAAPSGSATA